MEISLSQSIESFHMPPKTDREYGETSFSSIPPELIEAARDLANRKNVYLYELFADATYELLERLKSGEAVIWPQTRPVLRKRGYHTRMETSALEDLRTGAASSNIKANVFFMAALRDYLRKNGIDVEV